MLSITIPETIQCDSLFDEMKTLIRDGVESFELNVSRSINNHLKISMNQLEPIYLNDVLSFIMRQQLTVQLVLNFLEPHLEAFAIPLVEKWSLEAQVCYAGKMVPTYLSARERQFVHYDVTNCLPNYYHLGDIKRAHFDVIHYFLRKNKVTNLRLHKSGLTEDVICWATENELSLSVYGVESYEQAEELLKKGVDYIAFRAVHLQGSSFHKITKKSL